MLLLILDGWGHREERTDNAIAQAHAPNWQRLLQECPHALVETHGHYVGLPDGQMGNSEVGHMNIGAGRVVYQELTRIDAAIQDGKAFFHNAALLGASAAAKGATLHILGLLSPGGVHSHENHILAMLDLAAQQGVGRVALHVFLDGRDTPPCKVRGPRWRSCRRIVEKSGIAHIATVSGRYYAMDRDQRWERA